MAISEKYKTKAMRYYRAKLSTDIKQLTPEVECPSYEESREIIHDDESKKIISNS